MSETRIPAALALLREKGWCKGFLHDDFGRSCIVGALETVHGKEAVGYVADMFAVARVLREQYRVRIVADFNDDPETTFEMVEAALEKAALERGGAL